MLYIIIKLIQQLNGIYYTQFIQYKKIQQTNFAYWECISPPPPSQIIPPVKLHITLLNYRRVFCRVTRLPQISFSRHTDSLKGIIYVFYTFVNYTIWPHQFIQGEFLNRYFMTEMLKHSLHTLPIHPPSFHKVDKKQFQMKWELCQLFLRAF